MKNNQKQSKFLMLKFLIVLILASIVFSGGFIFSEWGGFEKLIPLGINFIRNKFLGDKTVFSMEKKYFSIIDTIKRKQQVSLSIDLSTDTNNQINSLVQNLTQSYLENNNFINLKDYMKLQDLVENFYPEINPILSPPEKNEGKWKKFLLSQKTFRPLYAKTFIRTDSKRKYAKVFLYKFDLDRLRFEFIPGKEDTDYKEFNGKMNKRQRKTVQWIFSGGFQYKHGAFGMMANNKILLTPKKDAATLLFYKDGHYKLERWTEDLTNDESIFAFRQNEILLINEGKITPNINKMWGLTPKDVDPIYTVRSGLGFNKDYTELIFAFGENLSAKSLALGMVKAGVYVGMHLDMNYYNVHFVNVKRGKYNRLYTFNENKVLSYYKNIYSYTSNRDYFILTYKDLSGDIVK